MATEMKKVTIDGVAYEAEAPVVATMHQLTSKLAADQEAHADALETLQAHADALEAERDQLKADNAKLDAELKAQPAQLQARVDARIALVSSAKDAGVEVKADSADRDIMIAVIAKSDKDFKADGKSDDYIQARFDAALVSLKPSASKQAQAQGAVKLDAQGKPIVQTNVNKIDEAEQMMRKKNASAWKRPTPQAK